MIALLVLPVALVHLPLADLMLKSRLGAGDQRAVRRMAVSFVEVLKPQAPPAPEAPPPAAPRPRPEGAVPTRAAASAPEVAATAAPAASAAVTAASATPVLAEPSVLPPSPGVAEAGAPSPLPASSPGTDIAALPAPAASPAAAATSGATVFEWPPSTRLGYTLTGWFRGPVEGQAQVEWLQRDARYQVHLDVSVGPAMAPLMARRMSSEGDITAQGLAPRRYQEETRMVLRPNRLAELRFESDHIVLANGSTSPRPAGAQDSASQFVQMTWLFTMQPQLLRAGGSVQMPLALPRRVEPWIYDLVGQVVLATPVGEFDTWHVKPRREARPGGDLTAEFWIAPSLQNLPVRIVIRQDAETFVDLVLRQLPEQARR